MALKRTITKDAYEKLPDVLKSEYKKSDTGDDFVLDTDDTDYKSKLDEFRTNNRTLHNRVEEMNSRLEKLKDIDPEKYQRALKALDEMDKTEEGKLIKEGKIDEVIKRRLETVKVEIEAQVKAKDKAIEKLTQERDSYRNELAGLRIEQITSGSIAKVGRVRQGALEDVMFRARAVWSLDENGKLVAKKPDGSLIYGPSADPLTPDEWAQGLVKSAPHLFEPAGGGGAGGGAKPAGDTKVLNQPSAADFGKNLEAIATGKVSVNLGTVE